MQPIKLQRIRASCSHQPELTPTVPNLTPAPTMVSMQDQAYIAHPHCVDISHGSPQSNARISTNSYLDTPYLNLNLYLNLKYIPWPTKQEHKTRRPSISRGPERSGQHRTHPQTQKYSRPGTGTNAMNPRHTIHIK